jgi:hypothetical protein
MYICIFLSICIYACDFCFKTDMNAKISKDNSRTLKLQLGKYIYVFMYVFMHIYMYKYV